MKTSSLLLLAAMTVAVIAIIASTLGCGDAGTSSSESGVVSVAPPPPAPPLATPLEPTPPVTTPDGEPTGGSGEPTGGSNATENIDTSDAPVAEVGFGAKGHYDSNDYISVTVSTQFRVQEQITLLRITNALQQYKAIHEGYPKTHEVFWKEIIEANGIQLPQLKDGEKFLYDPELAKETNGEDALRILRPKKQ